MTQHLRAVATGADPMLAFCEAMPDGMLVSDTDGRIILVNALLTKLSGYAADELTGQPVEALVPDRYRVRHESHRGAYYDSGLPPRAMGSGLEIFLRHKDGSEIPVDIALSTIRLGGRTLVIGAVRDATERRWAEAATRENERRWRTLLESVRLVVVGLDRERRITYANPFLRQVSGYVEEELLGQNWFTFCLPPGASDEVLGVFDQLLTTQTPEHYVNAIRTKTGEQRVIAWNNAVLRDVTGDPVGTLSIGEDITDRTRAEERLQAVNEVTRAILDNHPVTEVLRIITRRSRMLVEASIATVVTPDTSAGSLTVQVADGEHASELEGMRFPADGSVSGDVIRSGQTLVLTDATADERKNQPIVRAAAVGPAMFAPLTVADRGFGTLLVGRPQDGRPFTEEERAVIELFASQAAVALEHARFQEETQRLAVLEDRDRIGRELHDGAIQTLFATGMRLQAALGFGSSEAAERIDQAVNDIDAVIRELRSYIFGLRPEIARKGNAHETLRQLALQLQETSGVTTVVDIDPDAAAVIQPVADLVQLVREALSNVARHARATTCRLFVGLVGETLHVEIDDDGEGFQLTERAGVGYGLSTLHERAEAIGAVLEIDSTPRKGTTIRAIIPPKPSGWPVPS